jgi:uncharacterized RDD family membrane protein YckC
VGSPDRRFLIYLTSLAVGFPLTRNLLEVMSRYLQQVETTGKPISFSDLANDQRYVSVTFGLAMIQLALSATYHISLIALRGATLGKLAAGIRVRPWDSDTRPTWRQAWLRWLTRDPVSSVLKIFFLYWLLDSVWPLGDGRRQCLHDKLPRTCVVHSFNRR